MAKAVWAGLDVGVETTSICVIDGAGDVLQEASCSTRLESIHSQLRWLRRRRQARIGLEAATGFNVARGLRSLGYTVELYEARQLSKFLRVRRNKTDAGDAIGIAEAGRLGASIVARVHLKSLDCQALQSRLTIRRHLIRQRVATMNLLCRQIELYGGRICKSKRSMEFRNQAESELRKLFGKAPTPLSSQLQYLVDYCEQLILDQQRLDREFTRLASDIEICRRFMEIPGVGPICALTFYAAIGDPHRFKSAADVGPYFGLTPKVYQSGLSSRHGRISRMGNTAVRTLLTHASSIHMRRSDPETALKTWAMSIEARRGRGKGRVALARKLAIVMLTMWKRGEMFKPEHATS
jgi:transposase